ncbi:MAG: TIGR02584 family CRISPR-associated protein [Candidatus Competibacteraceae bacterium]|nr:TIGR02584 family CRISPR-associated protein [Candidatus Competibacteraceae bacterium]MCP5452327.1 TIGR02584 family CRISPR-associated protein [Gammaproteobacteria bacterium]
MNPEKYSRRILICVAGLSPQIVTETLYALSVTGEPRFVPTEIHLLTTAEGAQRARLTLLSDEPGWFHRLRRDYGLPDIRFTLDTIHLLRAADGRLLNDIREVADNEAIADVITAKVRELTADPESAVHASIAGGRKTMGFYLGYALSLFGRPQDRLSHVLVSSPFESNPNFFYPTPVERVIFSHGPDQRPLDASDATVMLADIPFVRLRDGLQETLLRGDASFSEVVRQAQRNLAAPSLTLDAATCRVRCGETVLRLTPISFAWLAWFARRALEGLPPLHWKRIGPVELEAFLAEYRAALNDPLADEEHPLITARRQQGIDKDFFDERNSKLKKELSRVLGHRSALNYAVQRQGTARLAGYALDLGPERIRLAGLEKE